MMCKETKRITPFKPKVLTGTEKEQIQHGTYVKFAFTNHEANKRGLASWTDHHRQTWELARMDEMSEA